MEEETKHSKKENRTKEEEEEMEEGDMEQQRTKGKETRKQWGNGIREGKEELEQERNKKN